MCVIECCRRSMYLYAMHKYEREKNSEGEGK